MLLKKIQIRIRVQSVSQSARRPLKEQMKKQAGLTPLWGGGLNSSCLGGGVRFSCACGGLPNEANMGELGPEC